jgi:hypothetical protein
LFSVANDFAMQAEGKGHLSCSQADTTFFGVERDASIDRGPSCGLRRDGKLTFFQIDSFTHADERSGTHGAPFFAEVAVIIVLVTASWIAYNDGRPSLTTEGVVAPQRSNTGAQQGPAEVGSVKKGFSTPQTASVPTKEVRKAARSTPRLAKVGEYEIDYISEDVTVHHCTSKPAVQQAPTRGDQVEYVSEDVTVRHFAPKLAVVSPGQPVFRVPLSGADACSATGIHKR